MADSSLPNSHFSPLLLSPLAHRFLPSLSPLLSRVQPHRDLSPPPQIVFFRLHFPIQKSRKTMSKMSSVWTSPVKDPKHRIASRRDSAARTASPPPRECPSAGVWKTVCVCCGCGGVGGGVTFQGESTVEERKTKTRSHSPPYSSRYLLHSCRW